MLVADVDGTLVGDDAALERLLAALGAAGSVCLVPNSSRPLDSVAATLRPLPVEPSAVVGALGTEVEVGGTRQDMWGDRFAGWDRGPVDAVMAELGLRPHPDELQTPLKASFEVPAAARLEAERRILDAGVDARFVHGDGDDFDVVPSQAGKEAPLGFLAERLGVDPGNVVAAGDGANDVTLLRTAAHAITVGNATEALTAPLTRATGVHRASATHAGGVLEGLRALGVLPEEPA